MYGNEIIVTIMINIIKNILEGTFKTIYLIINIGGGNNVKKIIPILLAGFLIFSVLGGNAYDDTGSIARYEIDVWKLF